jgi:hypothetical protein
MANGFRSLSDVQRVYRRINKKPKLDKDRKLAWINNPNRKANAKTAVEALTDDQKANMKPYRAPYQDFDYTAIK